MAAAIITIKRPELTPEQHDAQMKLVIEAAVQLFIATEKQKQLGALQNQ